MGSWQTEKMAGWCLKIINLVGGLDARFFYVSEMGGGEETK